LIKKQKKSLTYLVQQHQESTPDMPVWFVFVSRFSSRSSVSEEHLEDGCLLSCCAVQSGCSFQTFQRRLLPPSSVQDRETVNTSETSVNFYQTTLRNNPEHSHLHTHRRENLKSHEEHLVGSSMSVCWSVAFFLGGRQHARPMSLLINNGTEVTVVTHCWATITSITAQQRPKGIVEIHCCSALVQQWPTWCQLTFPVLSLATSMGEFWSSTCSSQQLNCVQTSKTRVGMFSCFQSWFRKS
jgi:hypothetical protein